MQLASVARIAGVALILGVTPLSCSSASADPCPVDEVVFARGTGEPPGLGLVGQAFVDSLQSHVPGRSIAVYPVNYPAANDYATSASAGADDVSAHVQDIVGRCPNTKTVLGGYSQGASVIELATDRMPPPTPDHVAAVVLFGRPASGLSSTLWGGPLPEINPAYSSETRDYCNPDDLICSDGADLGAHLNYVQTGVTDQAAAFAASRL
ncbi:cutinase family protein [Mycobacterium sp.]|uniref:cutinase family protein n=1 Tax=Mycobacterium sp. TaxID=1785 RepID=UPI0031D899FE